ncbi:HAD domain-containing protein [Streptomyces sp. NPDC028635]|uniref:HAD domain-containing protein n=1 Tax=Streptomyces sp. NPDC028635 TaxID=3154800 RepID=UPI0033C19E26
MLLVDVDGPLNPYAAKPHRRPAGYRTHRLLTPRWEASERRRLAEWGLQDKPVKPLRVWLDPRHGAALGALPFDLVWATTWEEEANAFIAPILGLPELPFIAWSARRREAGDDVFWKTPEIVAWAQGRAFAWVDDEITEADRVWVKDHHDGPSLLHRVDPRRGLTMDDFAVLTAWAARLG